MSPFTGFVLLQHLLLYGLIVSVGKTADKPELYDVFVSYNWTHQELVHKIADELKKAKFKVWIDKDKMSKSHAGLTLIIITRPHRLHTVCRCVLSVAADVLCSVAWSMYSYSLGITGSCAKTAEPIETLFGMLT